MNEIIVSMMHHKIKKSDIRISAQNFGLVMQT